MRNVRGCTARVNGPMHCRNFRSVNEQEVFGLGILKAKGPTNLRLMGGRAGSLKQTCHWRPAARQSLVRNHPHTTGRSAIPIQNSVGMCCMQCTAR